MSDRYNVIITSSKTNYVKKISIPSYLLYLTAIFTGLLTVFLVVIVLLYGRVYLRALKANRLEAENRILKKQNAMVVELARKVNKLETLRAQLYTMLGYDKAPKITPFTQNTTLMDTSIEAPESNQKTEKYRFSKAMAYYLITTLKNDSITPEGFPVKGIITRGFSYMHKAIDIGVPTGTYVHVTAFGTVDSIYNDTRLGKTVIIKHGDNFKTLYGHLGKVYVYPGKSVAKGDVIGTVGLTGFTTGPHLHYAIFLHNHPVDPMQYCVRQ